MIRLALAFLLTWLLAACAAAPKPVLERIVLLPNEDGRPSALVVTRRDGKSVELNRPYAAAMLGGSAIATATLSAADVGSKYAALLAVQPPRVKSYSLYFEFNRVALTADSQREVERVLVEAAVTPAAEIDVIGHTDTKGGLEFNDNLGRSRAQHVAALMQQRGFERARLSVQSRGEREPLVPTPDETDEPRNRRVEIRLR